ncbi:serine/threonine protein kinase [Capronia coronata CBS 617.96]|uniref:Serine/threonine protein kinase n=1 Tax=Capronia coronata CBS 617.96 TaxID=1182541 RepID=W9Z6S9_9EURO|nr:serine/threonine protein kinase [Capronia coronata CBS 617.96]EXJ90219.1 serine/threonine protein kinase [Capronia coronata CBS 617.96]
MGIPPHDAESQLPEVESELHHPRHLFIRSGMWQKLHNLFAKDESTRSPVDCPEDEQWPQTWPNSHGPDKGDPSTRPLAVGLPRQATFRRQNSERRDRLFPVQPCHAERRATSSTRHGSTSLPRPRATSSPPTWNPARISAPALAISSRADATPPHSHIDGLSTPVVARPPNASEDMCSEDGHRPPRPPSITSSDDSHFPTLDVFDDKFDLRDELDRRWILNLSMHFRDRSDREKFFVTYAETPNHWRRVTISCDYRNAEPGSLEMDLKELQFQRDKSLQIYESIRDSLPDIQFYDSVTNLKLETTDGRLHVHVTEDVNEIVPYPPRHTVAHILEDDRFRPMEVRESDLDFHSHLSGFVYKVRCRDNVYIKKEIPGPDTVDEFLYEINALHALHGSSHVIQLEAIVFDDTRQFVKGLLISFAERGAIVDLLYDQRGSIPWEDRCRWAEHAVRGLSEIHEEGYVQGDFTLSNIVVDSDGNAKIIDINRRGCPVGWEPPEIATKIASQQRISMYIGEKSDLYQLGMTLWALAMDDDEPERHVPPLSVEEFPSEVPEWYQDVVRICLSPRPKDRLAAKELINFFPGPGAFVDAQKHEKPALKLRTMREYIDPEDAVGRDDIERLSLHQQDSQQMLYSPESSRDDYTFTWPRSSNYEFDSEAAGCDGPRGRMPPTNYGHLGRNERHHWEAGTGMSSSMDEPEPNIVAISPGLEREFDEVDLDGHPYLISRRTFNNQELEVLERSAIQQQQDLQPQRSGSSNPTNDVLGPLDSHVPFHPRRPSLPSMNSQTADSTPRNSHTVLPTLARRELETSTTVGSPADSSGPLILAQDPDPDPGLETPQATATNASTELWSSDSLTRDKVTEPGTRKCADSTDPAPASPPPRLCYADSGYDEPLGLTEDEVDGPGAPMHEFPILTDSANTGAGLATQTDHQNNSLHADDINDSRQGRTSS